MIFDETEQEKKKQQQELPKEISIDYTPKSVEEQEIDPQSKITGEVDRRTVARRVAAQQPDIDVTWSQKDIKGLALEFGISTFDETSFNKLESELDSSSARLRELSVNRQNPEINKQYQQAFLRHAKLLTLMGIEVETEENGKTVKFDWKSQAPNVSRLVSEAVISWSRSRNSRNTTLNRNILQDFVTQRIGKLPTRESIEREISGSSTSMRSGISLNDVDTLYNRRLSEYKARLDALMKENGDANTFDTIFGTGNVRVSGILSNPQRQRVARFDGDVNIERRIEDANDYFLSGFERLVYPQDTMSGERFRNLVSGLRNSKTDEEKRRLQRMLMADTVPANFVVKNGTITQEQWDKAKKGDDAQLDLIWSSWNGIFGKASDKRGSFISYVPANSAIIRITDLKGKTDEEFTSAIYTRHYGRFVSPAQAERAAAIFGGGRYRGKDYVNNYDQAIKESSALTFDGDEVYMSAGSTDPYRWQANVTALKMSDGLSDEAVRNLADDIYNQITSQKFQQTFHQELMDSYAQAIINGEMSNDVTTTLAVLGSDLINTAMDRLPKEQIQASWRVALRQYEAGSLSGKDLFDIRRGLLSYAAEFGGDKANTGLNLSLPATVDWRNMDTRGTTNKAQSFLSALVAQKAASELRSVSLDNLAHTNSGMLDSIRGKRRVITATGDNYIANEEGFVKETGGVISAVQFTRTVAPFAGIMALGTVTGGLSTVLGLGAYGSIALSTGIITTAQGAQIWRQTRYATPEERVNATTEMVVFSLALAGLRAGTLRSTGKQAVANIVSSAGEGVFEIPDLMDIKDDRFYTIQVKKDKDGKEMMNPDGTPVTEKILNVPAVISEKLLLLGMAWVDWGKDIPESIKANQSQFVTSKIGYTDGNTYVMAVFDTANKNWSTRIVAPEKIAEAKKHIAFQTVTADEFVTIQAAANTETLSGLIGLNTGRTKLHGLGMTDSSAMVWNSETGSFQSFNSFLAESGVTNEEEARALFDPKNPLNKLNLDASQTTLGILSDHSAFSILNTLSSINSPVDLTKHAIISTTGQQALNDLVEQGLVQRSDKGLYSLTDQGNKVVSDSKAAMSELDSTVKNLSTAENNEKINQRNTKPLNWQIETSKALKELGYSNREIKAMSVDAMQAIVDNNVNRKDYDKFADKNKSIDFRRSTKTENFAAQGAEYKEAADRFLSKATNLNAPPVFIDGTALGSLTDVEKEALAFGLQNGLLVKDGLGNITNNTYALQVGESVVNFGVNGYEAAMTFMWGVYNNAGDTDKANQVAEELAIYRGQDPNSEQFQKDLASDLEDITDTIDLESPVSNFTRPVKSKIKQFLADKVGPESVEAAEATRPVGAPRTATSLAPTTAINPRDLAAKDFNWAADLPDGDLGEFVAIKGTTRGGRAEIYRKTPDGNYENVLNPSDVLSEQALRDKIATEGLSFGTLKPKGLLASVDSQSTDNVLMEVAERVGRQPLQSTVAYLTPTTAQLEESEESLKTGSGKVHLTKELSIDIDESDPNNPWNDESEAHFDFDPNVPDQIFVNEKMFNFFGDSWKDKSYGKVDGVQQLISQLEQSKTQPGITEGELNAINNLIKVLDANGEISSSIVLVSPTGLKNASAVISGESTSYRKLLTTSRHEYIHTSLIKAVGEFMFNDSFTEKVENILLNTTEGKALLDSILNSNANRHYKNQVLGAINGNKNDLVAVVHELLAHSVDISSLKSGLGLDLSNLKDYTTVLYDIYNQLTQDYPEAAKIVRSLQDPEVSDKIEAYYESNKLESSGRRLEGGTDPSQGTSYTENYGQTSGDPAGVREDAVGAESRRVGPLRSADIEQRDRATFLSEKQYKDSLKSEKKGSGPTHLTKELVIDYSDDRFDRDSDPDFLQDPADSDMVIVNRNMMIAVFDFTDNELTWGNPWRFNALNSVMGGEIANKERVSQLIVAHMAQAKLINSSLYREYRDIYPKLGQYVEAITGKSFDEILQSLGSKQINQIIDDTKGLVSPTMLIRFGSDQSYSEFRDTLFHESTHRIEDELIGESIVDALNDNGVDLMDSQVFNFWWDRVIPKSAYAHLDNPHSMFSEFLGFGATPQGLGALGFPTWKGTKKSHMMYGGMYVDLMNAIAEAYSPEKATTIARYMKPKMANFIERNFSENLETGIQLGIARRDDGEFKLFSKDIEVERVQQVKVRPDTILVNGLDIDSMQAPHEAINMIKLAASDSMIGPDFVSESAEILRVGIERREKFISDLLDRGAPTKSLEFGERTIHFDEKPFSGKVVENRETGVITLDAPVGPFSSALIGRTVPSVEVGMQLLRQAYVDANEAPRLDGMREALDWFLESPTFLEIYSPARDIAQLDPSKRLEIINRKMIAAKRFIGSLESPVSKWTTGSPAEWVQGRILYSKDFTPDLVLDPAKFGAKLEKVYNEIADPYSNYLASVMGDQFADINPVLAVDLADVLTEKMKSARNMPEYKGKDLMSKEVFAQWAKPLVDTGALPDSILENPVKFFDYADYLKSKGVGQKWGLAMTQKFLVGQANTVQAAYPYVTPDLFIKFAGRMAGIPLNEVASFLDYDTFRTIIDGSQPNLSEAAVARLFQDRTSFVEHANKYALLTESIRDLSEYTDKSSVSLYSKDISKEDVVRPSIADPVDGFFDPILAALESPKLQKVGKTTGEQWYKLLQNTPGVKKENLDWSVGARLLGPSNLKRSMTYQELKDLAKESRIVLERHYKYDSAKPGDTIEEMLIAKVTSASAKDSARRAEIRSRISTFEMATSEEAVRSIGEWDSKERIPEGMDWHEFRKNRLDSLKTELFRLENIRTTQRATDASLKYVTNAFTFPLEMEGTKYNQIESVFVVPNLLRGGTSAYSIPAGYIKITKTDELGKTLYSVAQESAPDQNLLPWYPTEPSFVDGLRELFVGTYQNPHFGSMQNTLGHFRSNMRELSDEQYSGKFSNTFTVEEVQFDSAQRIDARDVFTSDDTIFLNQYDGRLFPGMRQFDDLFRKISSSTFSYYSGDTLSGKIAMGNDPEGFRKLINHFRENGVTQESVNQFISDAYYLKYGPYITAAKGADRFILENSEKFMAGLEAAASWLDFREANKAKFIDLSTKLPTSVPEMPFMDNWTEISAKATIRMAAELGAEHFIWTAGEAQSMRYGKMFADNIGEVNYEELFDKTSTRTRAEIAQEMNTLYKEYRGLLLEYDRLRSLSAMTSLAATVVETGQGPAGTPLNVAPETGQTLEDNYVKLEYASGKNTQRQLDIKNRMRELKDELYEATDTIYVSISDKKGNIVKEGYFSKTGVEPLIRHPEYQLDKLKDFIGATGTKKISESASSTGTIQGKDLDKGNKFYDELYDNKYFRAVKKYADKHGLTIEKKYLTAGENNRLLTERSSDADSPVWYMPLNESIKKDLMGGVPLYSKDRNTETRDTLKGQAKDVLDNKLFSKEAPQPVILPADVSVHDGFYSNIEAVLSGFDPSTRQPSTKTLQNKALAKEWLNILQKTPGIKKEELVWSGIYGLLESNPDRSMTLQDLKEVIRVSKVTTETMYNFEDSDSSDFATEAPEDVYKIANEELRWPDKVARGASTGIELVTTVPLMRKGLTSGLVGVGLTEADLPKGYTVTRAPNSLPYFPTWAIKNANGKTVGKYTAANADDAVGAFMTERFPLFDPGFRYPVHFENRNFVVHSRNTIREVDGVRAFYLEELQSDLHAKGRDYGYFDLDKARANRQEFQAALEKYNDFIESSGLFMESPEGYGQVGQFIKNASIWIAETQNLYKDRVENGESIDWAMEYEVAEQTDGFDSVGVSTELSLDPIDTLIKIRQLSNLMAEVEKLGMDVIKDNYTFGQEQVPAAPFEQNWMEVGLKRAIHEAARQGATKFMWTTGTNQVDRNESAMKANIDTLEYDVPTLVANQNAQPQLTRESQLLDKYKATYDKIYAQYDELSRKKQSLEISSRFMPGSPEVQQKRASEMEQLGRQMEPLRRNLKGAQDLVDRQTKIVDALKASMVDAKTVRLTGTKGGVIKFKQTVNLNGTTNIQGQNVTLEQIIGKEMAKKIREDKTGQGKFEGDELTVGGDFYKFIYDDKMVKAVTKIFKQYGITPTKEMVQLAGETTDVREISEDQTGFTVANAARVIFNAKNKANLEIKVTYKDGGTVVTSRAEDLIGEFDTYAQRFVQGQKVATNPPVKLEITSKDYSEEVWSFDIPEVMAHEAKQGLPLYSKDSRDPGYFERRADEIRNGRAFGNTPDPKDFHDIEPQNLTEAQTVSILTQGNYVLMEGNFDTNPQNLTEFTAQANLRGLHVKVVVGFWEGKKSTAVLVYGKKAETVKNFGLYYAIQFGEDAIVGGEAGKHYISWPKGENPYTQDMPLQTLKSHPTSPKVNSGTIIQTADGKFLEFMLGAPGQSQPLNLQSPQFIDVSASIDLAKSLYGNVMATMGDLLNAKNLEPYMASGKRNEKGFLINKEPVVAAVNGKLEIIGYARTEVRTNSKGQEEVSDVFVATKFLSDGTPNTEWYNEDEPNRKYVLRAVGRSGQRQYVVGENLYKINGKIVTANQGLQELPLTESQMKEAHRRSLKTDGKGNFIFRGVSYKTLDEAIAARKLDAPKKYQQAVWKESNKSSLVERPSRAVMFTAGKGLPSIVTRMLIQTTFDRLNPAVVSARQPKPAETSGPEWDAWVKQSTQLLVNYFEEIIRFQGWAPDQYGTKLDETFFGTKFQIGMKELQNRYPDFKGEVGDRFISALIGAFSAKERITATTNWTVETLNRITSIYDDNGALIPIKELNKIGIHNNRAVAMNLAVERGLVKRNVFDGTHPEFTKNSELVYIDRETGEEVAEKGKGVDIYFKSGVLEAFQDTFGPVQGMLMYLNETFPTKAGDKSNLGAQLMFGKKAGSMSVMGINKITEAHADDIHVYRHIMTILGMNVEFPVGPDGKTVITAFDDTVVPEWVKNMVDNMYDTISAKHNIPKILVNQLLVYGPALKANQKTYAGSRNNDFDSAVQHSLRAGVAPQQFMDSNPTIKEKMKSGKEAEAMAKLSDESNRKLDAETTARYKMSPLYSKDRESLQAQQEILAQTDEALNNMDPDAWIAVAERLVTHNKLADSEKEAIKLLAQQGRRDDLQKYVLSLSKQSVLELFVNVGRVSLLLGLKNIQKNIGGNSLRQFMDEISRIPASILDTVFVAFNRAIGGQNFDRSTTSILTNPTDTLAAWKYALGKGVTEGGKQFIDILRGDNADVVFEHPSLFRERTTGWKILKPLETFEKYGWRFQGALDRPFNAAAYYRTLHELQMMRMREEHKAGNKITFEEAEEYLTQADFELAEMYSLQATYQKKNVLADKYYSMIDGLPPTWRAIVSNIFKFVKTPLNVVDYVLDYTGIWQIAKLAHREYGTKDWVSWKSTVKKVLDNPQDRKILSMAISQGAIGTVMTYIGYMMAQAGLMMPWFDREEKKEGEQMEAKGTSWGEAIIGGKSVDISWLSPNSFYLMMGATMFSVDNTYNRRLDELTEKLERAKAEGDAGAIEKAEQELNKHRNSSPKEEMFSRIFKNFALQAPFLRQIDDIKTSYDQNRLLSGLGEKWFSPEVYVPAIVKEIARTKDQYARVTTDVSILERMTEKVQANIPSLPGVRRVGKALEDTGIFGVRNVGKLLQGREALPIKYDMYGRPILTGSGLEATASTPVKADKLTTEMDRLNVTISKPTGATTVEENRLRKEKGEKYTPYLERAIQSPEYQKSDDKTKKRILEQVIKFLNENRAAKLDKKEEQHNLSVLADREFYRTQLRNNPGQFAREAVITDKETVSAFVSAGLSSTVSFNQVIADITKTGNLDQWVNAKFNYEFTVSDRQPLVDAQRNYEEFRKDPQSYIIRLWARDKRAQESRERNQELRAKLFDEGKDKEEVEKELRKQSNRRGAETRRRQGSVRQITVTK